MPKDTAHFQLKEVTTYYSGMFYVYPKGAIFCCNPAWKLLFNGNKTLKSYDLDNYIHHQRKNRGNRKNKKHI